MNITIEKIARTIDERVEQEWDENPIGLLESSHRLYGAHADGLSLLASADDPYDLFDKPRPSGLVGAGVVTVGWATPINSDGEPTGERCRVRLVACYNGEDWAVIMRLAGQDEPQVMTDAGEGALADTIGLWWHISGMFAS